MWGKGRNMKIIAVIPARYGSSRFPGKPLAKLGDKFIIQHVYEQAQKSGLFKEIIVGTDDQRIFEAVDNFGGKVTLTSKQHKSGTDRVAEVCNKMTCCHEADVIVNVQGDEPFISEKPLKKLIAEFDDPDVQVATLMHTITENLEDPNVVKVICDENSDAISFSRTSFIDENYENFKHIGVYAFRRKSLFDFVKLSQTKREKNERLEQLRLLDNGYKIRMVLTDYKGIGIDTPEDLKKAERLIQNR